MAEDEAKPALCTAFQSGSIPDPPCLWTEATSFYRDLELWLWGQCNKDSVAFRCCYGEKKHSFLPVLNQRLLLLTQSSQAAKEA